MRLEAARARRESDAAGVVAEESDELEGVRESRERRRLYKRAELRDEAAIWRGWGLGR